jgi:transcriptional regulator with GAF, ATPase, and Fis domain
MDSEITIPIGGETGTGKELVARCIHFIGPRKSRFYPDA